MFKYAWYALVICILFSCICDCTARSASSGSSSGQNANSVADESEQSQQQQQQTILHSTASTSSAASSVWKDLSMVYRLYQQCAAENLSVCLKVKLLTGLEKAMRSMKTLKIMEGVKFIKADEAEFDAQRQKAAIPTEEEIEANLPRALDAKDRMLDQMMFRKLVEFVQQHTLQVNIFFNILDFTKF